MNVGVDGSALGKQRTGVGRYISTLLETLIIGHPDSTFFVYSNGPIELEIHKNVHLRISKLHGRGPVWQNIQLPLLIKRDRLDVYWGGNGLLPAIGLHQIATVLTIHDLVYYFAGETTPWISRLGRRLFQPLSSKKANKIVADSQATAQDVELIYDRKVDAILYPVVSSRFRLSDPLEIERVGLKLKLDIPYILTLGTMEPRKNLPSLIDAYILCRQRGVHLPRLVIAGKKGWLDNELTRRIQKAEEHGVIQTLGYVDDEDLPGLYGGAEAFIFPSRYEGFGMPLLEAQLCGTPVLYGNHPAMREAAGGVGVEFEPTVDGIANILSRFAAGTCNLTCRVPSFITNSAVDGASILWHLLVAAAEENLHK